MRHRNDPGVQAATICYRTKTREQSFHNIRGTYYLR